MVTCVSVCVWGGCRTRGVWVRWHGRWIRWTWELLANWVWGGRWSRNVCRDYWWDSSLVTSPLSPRPKGGYFTTGLCLQEVAQISNINYSSGGCFWWLVWVWLSQLICTTCMCVGFTLCSFALLTEFCLFFDRGEEEESKKRKKERKKERNKESSCWSWD